MFNKTQLKAALTMAAVSLLMVSGPLMAQDQKPKVLKPCMQCHTDDGEMNIRGKLGSVSMKAETIKIDTGGGSWLVNFDDDTALTGAEAFNKIGAGKEILITYTQEDGALLAESLDVKPPANLDPAMLIKIDELAPLVEMGPEKGAFTIVDARPGKLYMEGYIPGALSIYDAQFEKNLDKLPKNKENLLVFYCGGPTWRLSPSSARRAEKLGYTNVRVFLDGMPAWKKGKKPLYSLSKSLKKQMDTETPVVVIDVRDTESAESAHISGAVSMPGDKLASFQDMLPDAKNAPIVLYGSDTQAALDHFSLIRGWGYKNTTVLKGGFAGWQKGDMPTTSGLSPVEKIVYVPKPKAGSVKVESFAMAADGKTMDVVILDVRTDEEIEEGKIADAITIPAEEVFERLGEIPKDKQVFVHCSTGVRAEMAYLTLKENGYNAKFLDATINVADGGKYTITAKD